MEENLQPFEVRREALTEQLKLHEQWEDRVRALNEAGVLEILPETLDIGISKDHSLDGADHPIPTYDEIKAGLTVEKMAIMERQAEAGHLPGRDSDGQDRCFPPCSGHGECHRPDPCGGRI